MYVINLLHIQNQTIDRQSVIIDNIGILAKDFIDYSNLVTSARQLLIV
jgi:hypothetical protein